MNVNQDIAQGLNAWATKHPEPNQILVAFGDETFTPMEFAQAYTDGHPVIVHMVEIGVDEVGVDGLVEAFARSTV